MRIPKYWAKSVQVVQQPGGRKLKLACWQWSDLSLDQAKEKANERAKDLTQKVLAGEQLNRYGYSERPLREEITQSVANSTGREIAIVTRNLYGALILNTVNAMFIDIDFPDNTSPMSLVGMFLRMGGGHPPSQEDQFVNRIEDWARRNLDLSLRVYRTAAGLRCLVTNQLFDPGQANSGDILQELGSDPLYVKLCKAQACYRARLTPKPWRCRMRTPPARYPWENSTIERRYREWEQRYSQVIAPYSVCKLVKQIGQIDVHPDVKPILNLHDQLTGVAYERKLA